MIDIPFGAVGLLKEISSSIKNRFNSHDVEVYFNEATQLLEVGNFDRALGFINAAIDIASEKETLLSLDLLKCTTLIGQLSMVIDDSISDNMETALTPQVMLSQRALKIRDDAFQAIIDALTEDPRSYLAYYLKGYVFLATLDFRNALRAFDDALALEPDQATLLSIYHNQASLYSITTCWSGADCRDDQKAIDCCERILEIDPTDETALILRNALTSRG